MDPTYAQQLLAAARNRIEHSLGELGQLGAHSRPDPLDAGDDAPELLEAEIDEGLVERLRGELDAVARAEHRLAAGTYGISIDSGRPIPDARLEAIPWAERTAEEQSRHDA